jgi:hypothetical protein
MPTKIVRLTENDLMRLVKKVLEEQTNPKMETAVKECFMKNLKMDDLKSVPSCTAIAMEILSSKKLPTDMEKGMNCVSEIVEVVGSDPFSAFNKVTSIGTCLLEKSKTMSPVMY